MKLRHVTFSGADDQVKHEDLFALSERYPYVEWGILFSDSRSGKARYPSLTWREKFYAMDAHLLNISAHLCGRYVMDICSGEWPLAIRLARYQRVQLNVSRSMNKIADMKAVAACLAPGPEYIIQIGSYRQPGLVLARKILEGGKASVLFDASGGQGVAAREDPAPPEDLLCGYAGGLSPDNLEERLKRLEQVVGEREIWVDMESGVRDEEDRLDLGKVERCLEIAGKYVGDKGDS